MADIILDLPGIVGESPFDGIYKTKIPVQSMSLNAAQEMDTSRSQTRTIHTVNVEDLSITRLYDLSSTPILDALISGKSFPTSSIYVLKALGVDNKGFDWFVKIDLEDTLIGSVNTSFSDSEITEEITLNFTKMTINYRQQIQTGAIKGSNTTNYDRFSGKKIA